MYDSQGNLKVGYTQERSHNYVLVDFRTMFVQDARLRTPNEASELNHSLKACGSNMRWVPETHA